MSRTPETRPAVPPREARVGLPGWVCITTRDLILCVEASRSWKKHSWVKVSAACLPRLPVAQALPPQHPDAESPPQSQIPQLSLVAGAKYLALDLPVQVREPRVHSPPERGQEVLHTFRRACVYELPHQHA